MGFRDKTKKKLRDTLAIQPRPRSVRPQEKQSADGVPSPNLASSQSGSSRRIGRRISVGNAGTAEAPLPVSESNSTAPMLISPKGPGELGVGTVPPSPASMASAPHVIISVAEDVPSLSPTGGTGVLEQSALTGELPLWKQAFDKLPEKDKKVFQSAEAREPGIFDDVVRMAEESKVACQQSQLKFRFRGKDIIVRDVAYKLITWVDKFKAVGDTAIQYDPVHAALPWAGVRFLLQIAVNQKESMEAVLVGLEQVVIPLVRCAIYEKLYLRPALSITEQLKIFLKELYLAILKFLAYAKRYLEKSVVRRVCEGLLESEGKLLFDEVEGQDSRIQREIAAAEIEPETRRLEQILTSLNEPIIRIDQNVACMYEQFQDYGKAERSQRRYQILQWLSQVEYEKHHKQAKSGLLDNTGEWLLEAEVFRDWRSSSASGILWLRGLVGTGKTKLVCRVISVLQERERGDEPVVYFYFNRNDPQRRDPTALLQAIVKQLSVAFSGLPKLVVEEYDKRQERGHAEGALDWEECRDLIVKLLDIYPQTTVVVDALDECDLDKRWILFDAIQAMTQSSGLVKIFVSSRDETDIRRGLEQIPYLFIDARKNTADIFRFVRRDVTDSLKRGQFLATVSEGLKEKIISTISRQANGMFQWAALQIHQLYAIRLAVDIEKTLGKLPATLGQTYDQIWTDIRDSGEIAYQLTTRALMWISCSMRPLNMEEWAEASYPPAEYPNDGSGATTLLGLCRNLVIWDNQLGLVCFAHLSVQEYLETRIFDLVQANSMAAQSCLSCLTYPKYALIDRRSWHSVHGWTFKNYALMWWGYHFEYAFDQEKRMSDQAREQLQEFLGTSTKPGAYYCKWLENVAVGCAGFDSRTHLNTECYYLRSIPPNPLFAMSFYNFGGELERHWELDVFNANCENLAREPLLHVAIVRGNRWVVEYLCSKGADVNAIIRRRSLLMLAIDSDQRAVVCSLLDRGAKIAAPDGVYPTLLHAAARRGGVKAVEGVLARGANISKTVILEAAKNEQRGVEVMKLLLTRNTKIKATEAVVAAALANRASGPDLMELLFDRDPFLQVTDEAVVAASNSGNFRVVEVVLDRRPDISEVVLVALAKEPGSPELLAKLLTSDAQLRITGAVVAAVMGNRANGPKLMELLLGRDLSLQVPNAAVVEAAKSTYGLQLIQRLLAGGAIPVTESLLIAASLVHECNSRLLWLLLTEDRDIKITDAVFVAAASNPRTPEEIVALLLARNPDLQITEAILVAAATKFPVRIDGIVHQLLARNPDIKITEEVFKAVASNNGSGTEIVQFLLARGPNIEITGAILTAAASNNNCGADILKLLLTKYPGIEITEEVLTTAVSNSGSGEKIVRLLLARNSDLKITEAVMTAAAGCLGDPSRAIIKMLSTSSHSFEVGLPYVVAVAELHDDEELLRLLLDRYPNTPTSEAELVVAAASKRHPELIVGFLLDRDATFKVTEAVVIAALKHDSCRAKLVELLLARAAELRISEAIAVAALERLKRLGDWEVLKLLLEKNGAIQLPRMAAIGTIGAVSGNLSEGLLKLLLTVDSETKITPALLVEAAKSVWDTEEFVQGLLAVGGTVEITEEVLVAAAANESKRGEGLRVSVALLRLFFARNPSLQITEAVMAAAAGSFSAVEVLKDLWVRDNTLRVTEAVVAAAAANTSCGPEVIRLLVARDGDLEVTERVMVAAAANGGCGLKVLELLLDRDVMIKVTEDVIVAASANGDCGLQVLELLLARDKDIKVTEKILLASVATIQSPDAIALLFAYDTTAETTEALVMAVARSGNGRTMARLLDRNPSIECTDAVVKAISEDNPSSGRPPPQSLSGFPFDWDLSQRRAVEIMEAFMRRDAARDCGIFFKQRWTLRDLHEESAFSELPSEQPFRMQWGTKG